MTFFRLRVLIGELGRACKKLENAAKAVRGLADIEGNRKRLYDEERLVEGLVRVVKKNDVVFKLARESAVNAMVLMTFAGDAVSEIEKGLYEHPGLIAALVIAVIKELGEWNVARERALIMVLNITTPMKR